ncbi:MAG: BamA/TamA family outer membrane protein, partial [Alphaproteobacteria bacterium]|nr:BamA/TamA family outer membrane protein [Alphaproteobacteria bacterium]
MAYSVFRLPAVLLLIAFAATIAAGGQPAQAQQKNGYDYTLKIDGAGRFESRLKEISDLQALKDNKPGSIWELRARIRSDIKRFANLLRTEGYYAARLSHSIDSQARPIAVTIFVDRGPAFTIETFEVVLEGADPAPEAYQKELERLQTALVGSRAANADIVAAYTSLLDLLPEHGYPEASLVDRELVADHTTDTVSVSITLGSGMLAKMGDVSFSGLDRTKASFLKRMKTWEDGQIWQSSKLRTYREELVDTGLFNSVVFDRAPESEEPVSESAEPVPVNIEAKISEREPRTIGIEAGYSTSKGFGGEIFWRHRNFFGRGENVRVGLDANEVEQFANATFTKPHFRRKNQKLRLGLEGRLEKTDAFRERSIEASIGLSRQFTPRLEGFVRLVPEYADLRDPLNADEDFVIIGVPVGVTYDGTDDLLNPSEGFRLGGVVTPTAVIENSVRTFYKFEINSSAYLPLNKAQTTVAAFRIRLGSILGQGLADIPANKRFYAGGGASLRGYDFRSVGPLDINDDSIGGRSVFEAGAELRFKITESIGLVPFVE